MMPFHSGQYQLMRILGAKYLFTLVTRKVFTEGHEKELDANQQHYAGRWEMKQTDRQ